MSGDFLTDAAQIAGRDYGMTGEQYLRHLALGDIRHPDAPEWDCGATDPRDDSKWCVLIPGHSEGHNRYAPPPPFRTWKAWEDAGSPERVTTRCMECGKTWEHGAGVPHVLVCPECR